MTKKLYFAIMGLMLILSIGFISANTLIVGKIYNSDFSDTISDSSITVECNSFSLTTTSLSDGAYKVIFDNSSNCIEGLIVKVTASKGTLNGETTSIVINSTQLNASEFFTIANINMIQKSSPKTSGGSSGGGGGGNYYYCGNGICDSGENTLTCSKDCPVKLNKTKEQSEILNEGNNPEETNPENSRGITGAVTGVLTGKGGMILIISMISLIVIFLLIIIYKKRKILISKFF